IPRTSAPTAAEDPNDEETTDDGPDAGVIAGAVVESLAGVGLMIGAIVVACRMGKKRVAQGDPATPRKSFKDTLRSIPRPVIHWTCGDSKNPKRVAELSGTASTMPQGQVRTSNQDSSGFAAQPCERTENLGTDLPARENPGPDLPVGQTVGTERPAGPNSQGWVRTQAQQLPYEIDA
ncbi:hypothetical protein B0J13DRAFT_410608, partial [Dactylonectria estremocensis]